MDLQVDQSKVLEQLANQNASLSVQLAVERAAKDALIERINELQGEEEVKAE